MKTRLQFHVLIAAFVAATALIACSDDDNGPAGPGDTTPPAVSTVTAEDASHINVRFSESIDRESAETTGNYTIVESGTPITAAPGDPVAIVSATLDNDQRTVVLTTGVAMTATGYDLTINGVADTDGNVITADVQKHFQGSAAPDDTPAEIVYHDPASGETGVPPAEPIQITFSEPVPTATVEAGLDLLLNGTTPVPVVITTTDNVHFTVEPVLALNANSQYVIEVTGIQDMTGNVTPETQWTFHTSTEVEN